MTLPDSDLGWINDYVGVPYVINGRSRAGWDCWGLLVAVFRDHRGLELPDWSQVAPYDLAQRIRVMDGAVEEMKDRDQVRRIPAPAPWAITFVARHRRPHHAGVCLGGGVLHCVETAGGTVYDPLARYLNTFDGATWWQWHG